MFGYLKIGIFLLIKHYLHGAKEHFFGVVVDLMRIGQFPNLCTNLLTQLCRNHKLEHLLLGELAGAICIVMLKHFGEHHFLLVPNDPTLFIRIDSRYLSRRLLLALKWLLLAIS